MPVLDPSELDHFRQFGWIRVKGAFSPAAAAAMCAVVWNALGKVGIDRDDPTTWTKTRPEHLQHLKSDPIFLGIGTERTIGAIRDVLQGRDLPLPSNWGAFFLHFPTGGEWAVPSSGWHMDGDYTGALSPPCGVLIHAMLNDVGPRCGGTNILSGSHRLIHRWFAQNPAAPGSRSAQLRKSLQRHPYLRDLCKAGDRAERIARFHDRAEMTDGIPLQVVENAARAGDLILMHTLLLHAVPGAHLGRQPRFLLSTGVQMPYWD
ncbi:MAG TPA: phytanoyl-CoA dioxygenase family protein [Steroidobacteraceae bacterium]|nr:phytanoyl-CoA dioxygenase family protein [Steroidobacteraceae bacterium]